MNWFEHNLKSEIQDLSLDICTEKSVSLSLLREDILFPEVSGNKFRKLKYSVKDAIEQKQEVLLSFGGAYSNHIAALARAANLSGLRSIGIIRGDELAGKPLNPTLAYAKEQGMLLRFVSRSAYKQKAEPDFIRDLEKEFGSFYLIPEGGTSPLAVEGCKEIWGSISGRFDLVCVPVGTGGTMAGLVAANPKPGIVVKGYSALAGTFQDKVVRKYAGNANFQITDRYNFGGYAKIDASLVRFINDFRMQTGVLLDPVYTAKMLFGITDEIGRGLFRENTRILALHTGGLQGIAGMNQRLMRMNLPQIQDQ